MTQPYQKEKNSLKIKQSSLIIFTIALAVTLYIFAKWISNDETNPLLLFTYAVSFFAFLFITVYEWMQLFDKEI